MSRRETGPRTETDPNQSSIIKVADRISNTGVRKSNLPAFLSNYKKKQKKT